MTAYAQSLEDEIIRLSSHDLDKQSGMEKQRLYTRVGQFLMGGFIDHWWCTYPVLMTFMMRILELYPGPDSVRVFYQRMSKQLGICCKWYVVLSFILILILLF